MLNYLIVHLYALLVFICVSILLRVLLGKADKIENNAGRADGIVGLEVTQLKE